MRDFSPPMSKVRSDWTVRKAGFLLNEDIIKMQHRTASRPGKWNGHSYDFYKIGHEHLYVFRKPGPPEQIAELKNSAKWW